MNYLIVNIKDSSTPVVAETKKVIQERVVATKALNDFTKFKDDFKDKHKLSDLLTRTPCGHIEGTPPTNISGSELTSYKEKYLKLQKEVSDKNGEANKAEKHASYSEENKPKSATVNPSRPALYEILDIVGLTDNHIKAFVRDEYLERISRGVYRVAGGETDIYSEVLFRSATLRLNSKSAVCLLSALEFYHLTDLISKKVWLMVDKQKRTAKTDIRVFRTASPHWEIGICREKGYSITTIERTLVDCLIQRKLIGTHTAIKAIKTAISRKETTMAKVINMAARLGVEHRLYVYFESLAY